MAGPSRSPASTGSRRRDGTRRRSCARSRAAGGRRRRRKLCAAVVSAPTTPCPSTTSRPIVSASGAEPFSRAHGRASASAPTAGSVSDARRSRQRSAARATLTTTPPLSRSRRSRRCQGRSHDDPLDEGLRTIVHDGQGRGTPPRLRRSGRALVASGARSAGPGALARGADRARARDGRGQGPRRCRGDLPGPPRRVRDQGPVRQHGSSAPPGRHVPALYAGGLDGGRPAPRRRRQADPPSAAEHRAYRGDRSARPSPAPATGDRGAGQPEDRGGAGAPIGRARDAVARAVGRRAAPVLRRGRPPDVGSGDPGEHGQAPPRGTRRAGTDRGGVPAAALQGCVVAGRCADQD